MLNQGTLQRDKYEFVTERACEMPATYAAREDVHDDCQVDEASTKADVGDVNGMIANDKFCFVRTARLQLTWSRYDVYLQRKARLASGYAPDVQSHRGGSYETAPVAHSATDDPTSRWPAALGSGVSVPPAMDSASVTGAEPDRLPKHTGALA